MWIWLLLIVVVAVATFMAIRSQSRRRLPEPTFTPVPGAFRQLAVASGVLDPGSAELTLGNGQRVCWDPPQPALQVEEPTSPRGRQSSDWRETAWVAAPQALLASAVIGDVIRSEFLLNDSMLAGLSQLSGVQVDGLADLRKVMAAKDYQLEGVKVQGTAAEQVAGGDFAAAGHTVAFPDASNNPGWDFTIDGNEVNSKLTADFHNVASEHFSEYPDIPIVINADAANIPEDALHFDGTPLSASDLVGDHLVIVDDSLTLAGIDDISADTVDAADGFGVDDGGGIMGLSLVIAAVRSSYQEGKLLRTGKTKWQRSLKNVAVDTTAKGGGTLAGGLAGAKVGAVVDLATGGATLGIPTAIGMLAGAIGGGLVGNRIANEVKSQPLREAQEGLQHRLQRLNAVLEDAESSASQKLETAVASEQARLERAAVTAHATFASVIEQGQREITDASELSPEETQLLLSGGVVVVDGEVAAFKDSFNSLPLAYRMTNRGAVARLEASAAAWKSHAATVTSREGTAAITTELAFDHVLALPGGNSAVTAFFGRIAATRAVVRTAAMQANEQLVASLGAMRARTVEILNAEADRIRGEARAQVEPQLVELHKARDRVIEELEMAGR